LSKLTNPSHNQPWEEPYPEHRVHEKDRDAAYAANHHNWEAEQQKESQGDSTDQENETYDENFHILPFRRL
jgi:hypothetical protein